MYDNIPMYETKQSRASVKNFVIILSKISFCKFCDHDIASIIIIIVLYLFIVRYGTSLHDKLYT